MLDAVARGWLLPGAILLLQTIAVFVPLLLSVAYLTYAERKVLAGMQMRRGPSTVGPFGLLQPIADAVKLLAKEPLLPSAVDRPVFLLAPVVTFVLALVAWAAIPVDEGWAVADLNVGVLFLFAVSALGVYGVIMAGWASNSRYAFLGAMRSAAQMVSYEISMGFVIVSVLLCVGSLNLTDVVLAQETVWFALPHLPMFVVFFVSILAETNRAPFDLPEGESELVGGYFVEYSGMPFALFFLGEYANMILMSALTTILFLGGWLPPLDVAPLNLLPGVFWFLLKVALVLFCFLWVRASFPRYRYDQLMRLGWRVFLPLSLAWLVGTAVVLTALGLLPE